MVLMQQVARYLMKASQRLSQGKSLHGATKYLENKNNFPAFSSSKELLNKQQLLSMLQYVTIVNVSRNFTNYQKVDKSECVVDLVQCKVAMATKLIK
jgi:hypothetical protein